MLRLIHLLIGLMWLVLLVYWLVSASRSKANAATQPSYGWPLRLAFLGLILVVVRLRPLRRALRAAQLALQSHAAVALTGLVLCALGLGLALAARKHLGRNWGMPMSLKTEPELVTSGPYAYARHPIYGGMMLGMLGSSLGENVFWVLPLVLFGGYFIGSAHREEQLMLAQFPDSYPAYRARTRRFIPFVI